jgi:DNA-binding transcriptional MerR regulator
VLTIGELARQVGVTPRAIRHYESIGLLAPAQIDHRTGYRRYGTEQLVRAVQIEQLKAAGLQLGEIRVVLDAERPRREVLLRRRAELVADINRRRHQLRHLDAFLDADVPLGTPQIVAVAQTPVIADTVTAMAGTLAPAIRRGVQRLRRRVHAHEPAIEWTFGARFPIEAVGEVVIEVVASHPALSLDGSTWPATDAVAVEVVGPHALLPAAHDAALAVAARARRTTVGTVCETYTRLGPVPRTTVAVPLEPRLLSSLERDEPMMSDRQSRRRSHVSDC